MAPETVVDGPGVTQRVTRSRRMARALILASWALAVLMMLVPPGCSQPAKKTDDGQAAAAARPRPVANKRKEPGAFIHDAHAEYQMGGGTISCRDCHHRPADMVSEGLPRPDHCFECHDTSEPLAMKSGMKGTRDDFVFDHDFHKKYQRAGKALMCFSCHERGKKMGKIPTPDSCWSCHQNAAPHLLK